MKRAFVDALAIAPSVGLDAPLGELARIVGAGITTVDVQVAPIAPAYAHDSATTDVVSEDAGVHAGIAIERAPALQPCAVGGDVAQVEINIHNKVSKS